MSLTIYSTDFTTTQSFQAGDEMILLAGVSITSSTSYAISTVLNEDNDIDLAIYGTVAAQ